ncbi:MAG: response regulator [bacterium]|nr:response regulator [bacterium]
MKRILVVDDAAFIRMMIKDALKGSFEIIGEAESVEDAIRVFREKRPDAVTMDISLVGELNGIDALQKIKEIDPGAVVIMVSSMGEEEYIRRSIDLGASEFIVKPFSKDKIRETMIHATGG